MVTIRKFNLQKATEADWQGMADLANARNKEIWPGDPPVQPSYFINMWRNIPPVVKVHAWFARNEAGEIVGRASLELLQIEENRHMSQCDVYVRPDYRRQGIGKKLLGKIVAAAAADQRSLIVSQTFERVPAGAAFVERIGGERGLEMHINQLDLTQLNRSMIGEWQQRAAERASGFELVWWENHYPAEHLEQICAVKDAMNQAPKGEMEMEDFHFTPDLLRQVESTMETRGFQFFGLAAREKSSGDLAGFTEMIYDPEKAFIIEQADTGVLENYRNLGLGRWLKAAMLEKIMDRLTEVRFVRTGNADANAPMLKINDQLGFKPYQAISLCQVKVEQAQKYLAR